MRSQGPVPSVEDATTAARTHHLDGALLDMKLGGKSPSPAADEFLERALQFLLVTGYAANDWVPPAFQTASRVKTPFVLTDCMLEVAVDRLNGH